MTVAARILANSTRTPNGCLLWNGHKDKFGYGRIRVGQGARPVVHRALWVEQRGALAVDELVCHSCDTPACCEITHLFVGSSADNSEDMKRKGRSLTGDRNPAAKISAADADEIKRMVADGSTQTAAGAQFGVTQSAVSLIVNGKVRTGS